MMGGSRLLIGVGAWQREARAHTGGQDLVTKRASAARCFSAPEDSVKKRGFHRHAQAALLHLAPFHLAYCNKQACRHCVAVLC
jgi:hypothetical protein